MYEITPVNYMNERVITFDAIEQVHGIKAKYCAQNFRRNQDKFIINRDYYMSTRREMANGEKIMGNPNLVVYLFTESGYLMLCKTLTDKISWDVQRRLVDSYFRNKETDKIDILINMQRELTSQLLEKQELANEQMRIFQDTMLKSFQVLSQLLLDKNGQIGSEINQTIKVSSEPEKSEFDRFNDAIQGVMSQYVSSGQWKSKKEFMTAVYSYITKKYGICYAQERIDFYNAEDRYPTSNVELSWWIEQKNPACKGILVSAMKTFGGEVRPKFPCKNTDDIKQFTKWLMEKTENKSPNGSAFYNKFFRYLDSRCKIDWEKQMYKYRLNHGLAAYKKVTKVDCLENLPKVTQFYNDFVNENYSSFLK